MVRSPRGRYPSSSGDPTGSPAARRVARLAITGSTVRMLATFGPVGTMYAAPSAASTPGLSGVMPETTGMPRRPASRASEPHA